MKLDEDLKDNFRSYIDSIIGEYSEKDFDTEKFIQFLFALYEQSSSLDDFSDTCLKELVDFFGDNTENFVNEILTHISINVGTPNEPDRRNSRASDHRDSEASGSAQSDNNRDDEDDLLPDEDDEEGDTNYRREKNKSDSKVEEQRQIESTNPSKSHYHRQPHEHKKDNKYQKNNQQRKQQYPQGPPPQMPSGMMSQLPMVPQMPGMAPPMKGQAPIPGSMPGGMPWAPYPYMYPMGYMPPTSYPPVYPPYDMMYPPAGQPQPYPLIPEGKPSDYDPLHPEMKSIGKVDIKPPLKPPEGHHNKRPLHRRDDQSEVGPTKAQVIVKEGKKTPKMQQQQHQNQPAPVVEASNPKTTIFVKNIPDYYNNLDALNKQLKRFGPIVNIKVDLKAKTAMIEFVKPKFAKSALTSKQPLFGNKEIVITGDLDAINQDNNNENKFDNQLLEKLKFLIEIRKHASEESKNKIVQKINEIKQAQKTKEIPDGLKKLLELQIFDTSVDFAQVIENVPDIYLADKNKLLNKLEAFGKLENFKLNPKTRVLDMKFYNLDNAKKAQKAMASELEIKFVSDKAHEITDKINTFEEIYLLNEDKKNGGDDNSGLHEEHNTI